MTERSLTQWLAHLETAHTKRIDLGLERVAAVADRMGLREPRPTVTVAGTNGKGTTVAVVDAALRALGLRVGRFTSPHLQRFNERVAIDGVDADDAELVAAFRAIDAARGDISLSYFEFSTLAALWCFREAAVDWQVLEVGLGGRLDAVNIIDADMAVITSIGLDHTEWLGDTREAIAVEKAGIARAGRCCIVADPEPPASLVDVLAARGAKVRWLGPDWRVEGSRLATADGTKIPVPAVPGLRPENMGAGLMAVMAAGFDAGDARVQSALGRLRVAGRQEMRWHRDVQLVLDVSHNRESVAALVQALPAFPSATTTRAIFACMADKPWAAMLEHMGTVVDAWFLPAFADEPRAASPGQLAEVLPIGSTHVCADFDSAWDRAMAESRPGDRLIVAGSFITVGAALGQLERDVRLDEVSAG